MQLEPDGGQKGWFGGLLRRGSQTPPTTPKKGTSYDKVCEAHTAHFWEDKQISVYIQYVQLFLSVKRK